MAGFDEVRFPELVKLGFEGGPEFSTTIVETAGGQEQRNQNWANARGRWRSTHELQDQQEFDILMAFFRARRGKAQGFRMRDWMDYCSDMVGLAAAGQTSLDFLPPTLAHQTMQNTLTGLFVGDGATTVFQLAKTYVTTSGTNYIRKISKPVAGVRVYKAGVLQTITTNYTIDTTTGLVTFTTAPGVGVVASADFLFDVPVRFDTDMFSASREHATRMDWAGVELVELRIGADR